MVIDYNIYCNYKGKTMDDLELVDLKRFCQILNVSEGNLRILINKKKVPPPFRLPGGRKLYWRKSEIEKWIKTGEGQGNEANTSD